MSEQPIGGIGQRKQYELNLRGVDVEQFKKNPIVTMNDAPHLVVGRAEFGWGKYYVFVTFDHDVLEDDWLLTPLSYQALGEARPSLRYLTFRRKGSTGVTP